MEAEMDDSFPLMEETADGWLKIQVGEEEGYLSPKEAVELEAAGEEELAAAAETAAAILEESRSGENTAEGHVGQQGVPKPDQKRPGPVFRQRVLLHPLRGGEESACGLHHHRFCVQHSFCGGEPHGGSQSERQAGDY